METNPQPPKFQCLRGKLLIAETVLRDPNFHRSVIFLAQHTPQGAHGYLLNQPLDRQVHELLEGEEFEALAEVPVYKGGPVGTDRLTFAALGWDSRKRRFSFKSHLSTDDARAAFLAGKDVRAYVGYSGWSPGQVEKEIEHHSWILADAPPVLADPDAVMDLWPRVLCHMGPFFTLISLTPAAPEKN